MKIKDKLHKLSDNQILYKNGKVWLVRETLSTNKKAEKRFKDLLDNKQLKANK